jgi:uncharacterized protein YpmB
MQKYFWNKLNYAKIIKTLMILIISLIIIFIGLLLWARQPLITAKHQATLLAEKKAGLNKINHFYMSDLNRTYYTVKGENKQHQSTYAIIEKKTGHIVLVRAKDGISAMEAQTAANQKQSINQLISIAPTIFNNRIAWAVSYFNHQHKLNYAIIDFKTGNLIHFIANA